MIKINIIFIVRDITPYSKNYTEIFPKNGGKNIITDNIVITDNLKRVLLTEFCLEYHTNSGISDLIVP